MYSSVGKIFVGLGILLILMGVVLLALDRVGILGKLPGDIHIRKQNSEFHFPLTTCIAVSVVLSLLLTAFLKWFKK